VGDNKTKSSGKENTCSECSYSSPHHSPQCSHNKGKPLPTKKPGGKTNISSDPQKTTELDRLKNLLETSKDMSELESVYQNIKSNPLYQGENYSDNKKTLENLYQ
jgi:hypothetical protein